MATHSLRVLSLCSGYGGLDLAVRLVFPSARTLCYVEREISCVRVLAARMEDGSLDPAPVWDDVATFDPAPWVGCVDLIVAGFPCQPHSVAGKREGTADARWPVWDDIIRIAKGCATRAIFLENVPGLLTSSGGASLDRVKRDLVDCGFTRCASGVISAAAVGAPFKGERWFCLGTSNGDRLPRVVGEWPSKGHSSQQGKIVVCQQGGVWTSDPPAEPCVFRVADGATVGMDRDQKNRIRMLGNGVVPLQAAAALKHLMEAL